MKIQPCKGCRLERDLDPDQRGRGHGQDREQGRGLGVGRGLMETGEAAISPGPGRQCLVGVGTWATARILCRPVAWAFLVSACTPLRKS